MNRYFVVLCLCVCVLFGTQTAAQTRRALLIGINTYQPQGTSAQHAAGCTCGRCELAKFPNLEGAVNDAQSMADLLTNPKFGFPGDQVIMLTNPAPVQPRPGVVVVPAVQTNRDGILAAMQEYLVDVPRSGDTVVFYDASHGSLRVNSQGNKLTVLVNGKYVHADSTLVPADAYKGGYDVRDREMTRIFNAALDKGIRLTVIFDSCHSGGATRGIGPRYRERTLAYDPRDINEAPDVLPNGQPRPAPTERPDNPALVFSAAQQDQSAKESPPSDTVTEPHGAFTAALVEALQVLPANAPASLVYQRVKAVLEGSSISDQEPDLDATAARRQQPLFGGAAGDSGRVRTAALKTDDDGAVWLDIGRVSGIGSGSEFTSMIKNSGGQTIKLRVADLQGIARSTAKVISPPGATVAAGEVFELTKWVPAESAPLRFWLWPSNLSEDDILAAAAQIKAAGVASVSDPAEEPWTDILCWDGTNWTVQHAGTPVPISLGAKLTANALKQHLPAGAKLWVNLPPPNELAAKLALHDSNSAVQAAPDLAGANYILTGVLTEAGPAYAWFHKSEFAAGPRASITTDHSPGCSTTSQYPVRTDWVLLADVTVLDKSVVALNKYAALLAKVHGWLELADSPSSTSSADYYTLTMVKAPDQTPLPADQPVHEGDRMKMALNSDDRIIDRRWVYILDIDCHGKGSLLYPLDYSENQFPSAADNGLQIVLPGAHTLRIGPPYGVDTLILLSTAQPLPDPYALNFEGVASRGTRGTESPLQKLLTDTSGGTRGPRPEIPTNWGLYLMTIRSIPKDAAK
ncbi:MAG: caspase family protein [Terriglobia bacterium]|jgi:hypothetical protein